MNCVTNIIDFFMNLFPTPHTRQHTRMLYAAVAASYCSHTVDLNSPRSMQGTELFCIHFSTYIPFTLYNTQMWIERHTVRKSEVHTHAHEHTYTHALNAIGNE